MSQILLVDDHAIVRSGIRRLLAGLPALQLSEAATGEEALEQVRRTQFQLLILDLNLPGLGGLELLRRLLKADPRLSILVFSLHTEAIYATRAMEAGARGFISKNAAPEEFLSAIDTVLAGGTVIERDIASEIAVHEIGENAYRAPDAGSYFAHQPRAGDMILGFAMGEIEAHDIDPGTDHSLQYSGIGRRGTESGYDLGIS